VNRLPQTPTTIEDHPIGSQPKRRSVEKRLLEPRIVGNQYSARLARSSEPVFDIGCQLITCRTVEQLLPLVEVDRRQHPGNHAALSLVEIKHNTAASDGSARQLRPTPATGETALPRHFTCARKRGRSSRDLPQQAPGKERLDSLEGSRSDRGSLQKAHDIASVTALKATPPMTPADNEHNCNQHQRYRNHHQENPGQRSNRWAV
jgi:hypothetical protein